MTGRRRLNAAKPPLQISPLPSPLQFHTGPTTNPSNRWIIFLHYNFHFFDLPKTRKNTIRNPQGDILQKFRWFLDLLVDQFIEFLIIDRLFQFILLGGGGEVGRQTKVDAVFIPDFAFRFVEAVISEKTPSLLVLRDPFEIIIFRQNSQDTNRAFGRTKFPSPHQLSGGRKHVRDTFYAESQSNHRAASRPLPLLF